MNGKSATDCSSFEVPKRIIVIPNMFRNPKIDAETSSA